MPRLGASVMGSIPGAAEFLKSSSKEDEFLLTLESGVLIIFEELFFFLLVF